MTKLARTDVQKGLDVIEKATGENLPRTDVDEDDLIPDVVSIPAGVTLDQASVDKLKEAFVQTANGGSDELMRQAWDVVQRQNERDREIAMEARR